MTFVGKVLVVVQVILSVCFMAFAGAVYGLQQDWKSKNAATEKQLAAAQQALTDSDNRIALLEADLAATAIIEEDLGGKYANQFDDLNKHWDDDYAKGQIRKLVARIAQAESEFTRLTTQLEQEKTEHARTQEEVDRLKTLSDLNGNEAIERGNEARKLRQANAAVHAKLDAKLNELQEKEGQIFSLETSIEEMTEKQVRYANKLADMKRILLVAGIDDQKQKELITLMDPPPVVKGEVLKTRKMRENKVELIEVSIGSDDGLVKGHHLDIFRTKGRAKYLGKIKLIFVSPDRSVGTLEEKNGTIEAGDHVSTKL